MSVQKFIRLLQRRQPEVKRPDPRLEAELEPHPLGEDPEDWKNGTIREFRDLYRGDRRR